MAKEQAIDFNDPDVIEGIRRGILKIDSKKIDSSDPDVSLAIQRGILPPPDTQALDLLGQLKRGSKRALETLPPVRALNFALEAASRPTAATRRGVAATARNIRGEEAKVIPEVLRGLRGEEIESQEFGEALGIPVEALKKQAQEREAALPQPLRFLSKAATLPTRALVGEEPVSGAAHFITDPFILGAGATKGISALEKASKLRRLGAVVKESQQAIPKTPTLSLKNFFEPKAEKAVNDAININLEKLNTTDDVKQFISEVAQTFKPGIEKARRGKLSFEEIKELASELSLDESSLLKRAKGKAFNAEEALAARQILVNSAEKTWQLSQAARGGSDEALVQFLGQLQRHAEIQKQVSGVTAEAGRALSAFRIPVEAGAVRERSLKQILKSFGDRPLTEEVAKRLSNIDPTDIRAVNKFIREATKATTREKVFEVWVNALLSMPTTQIVNITSNALTALSRPLLERPLAAGIDVARASLGKGGERTVFLGESFQDLYGMWEGIKKGTRAGLEAFKTGLSSEAASKLEPAGKAREAIKGRLGEVIRTPGKTLTAFDEFFKAVNGQGELHAQAYRQAVKEGKKGQERIQRIAEIIQNPSEVISEKVRAEALYRTFQTELGATGKSLQALRASTPGMEYIIPFLRTPINISKYGLERTPLNFLRLAAKRGSLPADKISFELAKATSGSLIGASVMALAAEGKITGGGPRDPEQRKALRAQGVQPYSFQIGDQYVSYGRLEPLGIVIGLHADFAELMKTAEPEEFAGKMGLAFAQNITNKTFMRGLSDAINAISNPEVYGNKWMKSLAGTVVPNIVAGLATASDPTLRSARTPLEQIQSRIPFLREDLPPVRDIWGRTIVSIESGPERFLSPVRRSKILDDKATNEVVRLGIKPGSPQRQLGKLELTNDEFDTYAKMSGEFAHRLMSRFVEAKNYEKLSDEDKSDMLKKLFIDARSLARTKLKLGILREIGQQRRNIPEKNRSEVLESLIR